MQNHSTTIQQTNPVTGAVKRQLYWAENAAGKKRRHKNEIQISLRTVYQNLEKPAFRKNTRCYIISPIQAEKLLQLLFPPIYVIFKNLVKYNKWQQNWKGHFDQVLESEKLK